MAEPPLLTLTDVTLGFGGRPLFSGVSISIAPGERLCIVGRNGSGKSTLMKIAAGLVEPDHGARFVKPGVTVAYLPQEPDLSGHATLGSYVAAPLAEADRWRAEAAMDGLEVNGALDPATASGGERRRAALARLLAQEPELMLLDEPTNHLDITAIEWLENHLAGTRTAFAIVSHDRALLARVTRSTLWLDRGEARLNGQGFAAFEEWRDKVWAEEDAARHKLDRLIRDEARWAVEGISARRRRNQGRLRRLQALRAERRAQIARTGAAAMALSAGGRSGKLVIEAEHVSKSYDGRPLFRDFSIRIARGERVAIVGPNGVGKTTLLGVLSGQLAPDAGTVRLGSNLRIATLDQRRAALAPDLTLWDTLVGDPALGVKGQGDQVMVRGRPRHVVAYLRDFLFDERQARGPVSALSAGGRSGKLVIEAEHVSKSYDGRPLFRDFSIRIARGERVAIVGPNGVGKTTLLGVLSGQLAPDAGTVRLGSNLRIATLDQRRAALAPDLTLWDTLVGDPALGVKGQGDQVMVRGRPRHVVAYLKDFLFDERQARGPVSALSGGERARLLLARIMARESNLLILDEPTNDLDVETLDLLEELVDEYDGTVLLVSHDRDFLDRVATTTIAMEGGGRAVAYAGGWSDYRAQRGEATAAPGPKRPRPAAAPEKPRRREPRLGYAQQRRLEALPAEIARLEAEIGKLEALLSDPDLYAREPAKFHKATEALAERRRRLDAAEQEWLELESLRESLAGG